MSEQAAFDYETVMALLRKRHSSEGWLFWTELGDGTGGAQHRRIDAFAMGVWPSLAYKRIAYEVKVSRSDWLKELRNPAKRSDFYYLSHEAWFVLGPGVLLEGERLPGHRTMVQRSEYGQGAHRRVVVKKAKYAPAPETAWTWDLLSGWGILEAVPTIGGGWRLQRIARAAGRQAWPMPEYFLAILLRREHRTREPEGDELTHARSSSVKVHPPEPGEVW